MEDFDAETCHKLVEPVKVGTPCIAKYAQDKTWYRGEITARSQKEKDVYTVFFIDYGNSEQISYHNLRRINKKLFQFEPQCTKAYLAYTRTCG